MHYHDITTDDMKNGDGLRVVLWVSGCNHRCKNCQNPITWDPNKGLLFTHETELELMDKLDHDYISGLTLSGGDPFYPTNLTDVNTLLIQVKSKFPGKTIWIYTGYSWEECISNDSILSILYLTDVLVDGPYIDECSDIKYPWAGSTNQRVINVQKSLEKGMVVRYEN